MNPGRDDERHMLKVNALPLETGDIIELQTGGGGGFGDPLVRDPEHVRRDVVDGYVTREAAERDYRVVLTDLLEVDEEATRLTRSG